jgi:Up-Regulated in long-lived daf-2
MGDKRTAQVTVRNDFSAPATLTLTHRYGDDGPPETQTWERICSGQAGPPLTVHYETGWFTSWDYWDVDVAVLEGREQGTYQCNDKQCYLKEEDQGTTHTFSVSPDGEFRINLISSGCEGSLTKTS